MKIQETLQLLESGKSNALMAELYGKNHVEENISRYQELVKGYENLFGDQGVEVKKLPPRRI